MRTRNNPTRSTTRTTSVKARSRTSSIASTRPTAPLLPEALADPRLRTDRASTVGHALGSYSVRRSRPAHGSVVQLAKGIGFHERIRRIKAARKAAEQARHAERTDPDLVKERQAKQQSWEKLQKERAQRFHRMRPKRGERRPAPPIPAAPPRRVTPAPPAAEPTPKTPPPLDLATLKGKSPREIGDAFRARHGEELGGHMGRIFRSKGSHMDEAALRRAALAKVGASSRPSSSRGRGGGRLNSTGTVSGLKKGKGAGWLAGDGAHWHVHYNHAKPGTSNRNRIDFSGRSQAQVLAAMDAAHAARPTKAGSQARGHWDASRQYVVDNPHLFH